MVTKDCKDYKQNAKKYVINMISEARTLHKKDGCQYSHYLSKYCDFDTLEEVELSGIDFQKCRFCFRETE